MIDVKKDVSVETKIFQFSNRLMHLSANMVAFPGFFTAEFAETAEVIIQ